MRLWYAIFDDWFWVRSWWLYPAMILGILAGTFIAEQRSVRRLRSRYDEQRSPKPRIVSHF